MKNEKNGVKKTTSRKAVSQAISKQEKESKKMTFSSEELQDAIRLKAYEIYLENGGSDMDNWLSAERIILSNTR